MNWAFYFWMKLPPWDPAEPYTPSVGEYRVPDQPEYPVHDQIWLVSFMEFGLGFFDLNEGRVEPGPVPFAPDKLSTM